MTGLSTKAYQEISKMEREVENIKEQETIVRMVDSKNGLANMVRAKIQKFLSKIAEPAQVKKFKLDKEDAKNIEIEHNGIKKQIVVHRIVALRSFDTPFGEVHAGDRGGYVEKEFNLDMLDNSWIFDDSIFCGEYSHMTQNSCILGHTQCLHSSGVLRNSVLKNGVKVYGDGVLNISNSMIEGRVKIHGNDNHITNSLIQCKGMHGMEIENLSASDSGNRSSEYVLGAQDDQNYANIIRGDEIEIKTWATINNVKLLDGAKLISSSIRFSNIFDQAEIFESRIENSTISGNAKITQSTVSQGCSVEQNAHVGKSYITDSEIKGNSVLVSCMLDDAQVGDYVVLLEVDARSQCRFEDSAQVSKVQAVNSVFSGSSVVKNDTQHPIYNSIIFNRAQVTNSSLRHVIACDNANIKGSMVSCNAGGSMLVVCNSAEIDNSVVIANDGAILEKDSKVLNSQIQGTFIVTDDAYLDRCMLSDDIAIAGKKYANIVISRELLDNDQQNEAEHQKC